MTKTKKKSSLSFTFPRLTQKIFIIAGLVAYLTTALYWMLIWVRVYPNGGRLSPFAVMAINELFLPVLLFVIAYIIHKKQPTRLSRVFTSSVLTFMGILIQIILWSAYSWVTRMQTNYNEVFASYWPMICLSVIVLISVTAMAMYSRLRTDQSSLQRLRPIFIALALVAFASTAAYVLTEATTRVIQADTILSLMPNLHLLIPFVLPIAFFLVGYAIFKKLPKVDKLHLATLYAAVGLIINTSLSLMAMITSQLFPQEWILSIYELIVPLLAFVVFLAVTLLSRRSFG